MSPSASIFECLVDGRPGLRPRNGPVSFRVGACRKALRRVPVGRKVVDGAGCFVLCSPAGGGGG